MNPESRDQHDRRLDSSESGSGSQRFDGFAWSADEFRRAGHRAIDLVAHYLEALPREPTFRPVSADGAERLLALPAPKSGTGVDELLDEFVRDIAPHPFGNGHPRFFGWVNSPPAPIGIVAELLAAAMNPSVAGGNHAAVYVERAVVNWLKTLLGFPDSSMGLLVSGGSVAAVTALTVARFAACARVGWSVRQEGIRGMPSPVVVYMGSEGHGCHRKAVELLGIGSANLRTVPSDDALRMIPAALDDLIHDDVAAGRIPMAVIATAGTVNTGSIDPIGAVADVCRAHGVWLHVDGAYGAPAILSRRYNADLVDIARADSITIDPHKWMYVPVAAGCILVKDAQAMRDAFSLVPAYLRTDDNAHGVQGPPWFSEYGMQQTRGFRGLKVWMAMRYFGMDGYRGLIEHDLELASYLADRLRASPGFEVHEPTSLSVVCFRRVSAGDRGDERHLTHFNKAILTTLQLGGEAFLSSTVLDERFWMRACIVNPLSTRADIDRLIAALVSAASRMGGAGGSGR